jgi:hypothetical protein
MNEVYRAVFEIAADCCDAVVDGIEELVGDDDDVDYATLVLLAGATIHARLIAGIASFAEEVSGARAAKPSSKTR